MLTNAPPVACKTTGEAREVRFPGLFASPETEGLLVLNINIRVFPDERGFVAMLTNFGEGGEQRFTPSTEAEAVRMVHEWMLARIAAPGRKTNDADSDPDYLW